jgi:hypothetical protein
MYNQSIKFVPALRASTSLVAAEQKRYTASKISQPLEKK